MNKHLYEFLEHGKRLKYSNHTIDDYNRTIREFLKFINENYPDVTEIIDITRDIVLSYEKYLVTKKDNRKKILTRSRRRRYLSSLKMFFNYLQKEEKIFRNPCVNIAIPREKSRIIKDVLTVEEIDRLLKTCKGDSTKSLRDRAILELLYSTGIRADELCNIEVNDFDFHENLLFVRKGKWGNERIVPFGQSAKYWLKRYIKKARPLMNDAGYDLAFVSVRGRKLDPQTVRKIIKLYAFDAGIEKNVTTHTMRHTCATHMLKGNADIRYVQKQLGHRRISTTERYLKIEISDLKEIHEKCHPREQDDWDT